MRSNEYEPGEDELGPVDFLAVEFPDGRISAAGFQELLSLARQGTIRILDAEFIVKDATSQRLAQLRELGDLKTAGALTDAEFEQQKARILNG